MPITTETKSRVTQLPWRPKPGQSWSQGRKFWAVAETCCHYPRRMLLGVAARLTQEALEQAQRWQARCLCTTSKPCPHGNLHALRLVGTSAVATRLRFQDARKRRPRNRPYLSQVVLKCCGNELIERTLPKNLSRMLTAQCGLNLSKVSKTNHQSPWLFS